MLCVREYKDGMDRKRKWDEAAEATGAGAQLAEGDTPLKAIRTEEDALTRSASHGGGGGVDKAAQVGKFRPSPSGTTSQRQQRQGQNSTPVPLGQ